MKHLNRNIYLLFIGMIEAFFIIYTIIMYRRGIVETGELVFGCCGMAIIAVMGIVVAFMNKKEDGPKLDLTEVPRSREGVIFEVLTVLILAVAWIVALVTDRFWIEGFYYFIESVTLFTLTFMAITVLWFVYMPRFISMVRMHTNMKQVALEIRMCRVLAVELALLVLAFALPLGDSSASFFNNRIIFYITGAVILVTVAIFVTLWYAHRPDKIIEKDKWPRVTNLKQAKLVIGSFRVVAIILALFLLLCPFQRFEIIWLLGGMSAVTFIWGIIFLIIFRRARG